MVVCRQPRRSPPTDRASCTCSSLSVIRESTPAAFSSVCQSREQPSGSVLAGRRWSSLPWPCRRSSGAANFHTTLTRPTGRPSWRIGATRRRRGGDATVWACASSLPCSPAPDLLLPPPPSACPAGVTPSTTRCGSRPTSTRRRSAAGRPSRSGSTRRRLGHAARRRDRLRQRSTIEAGGAHPDGDRAARREDRDRDAHRAAADGRRPSHDPHRPTPASSTTSCAAST